MCTLHSIVYTLYTLYTTVYTIQYTVQCTPLHLVPCIGVAISGDRVCAPNTEQTYGEVTWAGGQVTHTVHLYQLSVADVWSVEIHYSTVLLT